MSLCVSGVRPRSARVRRYARGLWHARRRGADEHGAVLVIVAGCLVLFLGLLAYTIDLGSGRQGQQKAQSAADASALAAADSLASCSGTAAQCASSATTAATSMASQNGVPSNNNNCTSGATGMCVVAPVDSSHPLEARVTEVMSSNGTFGGSLGHSSSLVSASSTADGTQNVSQSVSSTTLTTATPGATSPLFTDSTLCNSIVLNGLNGGTIDGIQTDGGVSLSGANGGTVTSLSYNGSSCSAPSGGTKFQSTSTNTGTLGWPIDYEQPTINCTGNGATVTQSGSTYTYSASSLTFQNSATVSGIYCANTITLDNSAVLSGSATFIANSFGGGISDTAGSSGLTPYLNGLLLYYTGTGTQQINSPAFLNGDAVFAPFGEIYLNTNALTQSTSTPQTFLIEANTFYLSGMNSGTWQVPSSLAGGGTTTSVSSTTVSKTTPGNSALTG